MKTGRRLLSALLCVVLLFGTVAVSSENIAELFNTLSIKASAESYGNLTYEINNGKVTITSCSRNATGNISIPSDINGNPVTDIGSEAFYNCAGITGITVPESISNIGRYAFINCSGLSNINVSASNLYYKSSGNCLIEKSSKTLLIGCKNSVIPDDGSVTYIGNYAFSNCYELTSITIPNTVITIGASSFRYCIALTSITIPDSVTEIGFNAFQFCTGLQSVILGKNITSINSNAFSQCSALSGITIPANVAQIGDSAFAGCSGLTRITVLSNNRVYHSNNNCIIKTDDKILTLGCKNSIIPGDGSVTKIGASAFDNCTGLTSITIPDCVESIDTMAFGNCSGLKSIIIPGSVKVIGEGAFWECSELTNISIYNGVESISNYAFRSCTSITHLSIPNSVTRISTEAFWGCSGLLSVSVSSNNPVFHSSGNCIIATESKSLIIGCNNSVIPNDGSVETIDCHAFSIRTGLRTITIPDSVKLINSWAFQGCSGLQQVTIPSKVTTIGRGAFRKCSNLKSVTIPLSVNIIGEEAFYGCSILTDVFYNGKRSDWAQIEIAADNTTLLNTDIHYLKEIYNVFFIADGITVSSADYYYGESIAKPTDPTKSGYVFTGWSPEVPATMPEQNLTFYAQWKVNSNFDQSCRYSFNNSHYSFFGHNEKDYDNDYYCDICGGAYYISKSDTEKLFGYIRKYDSNSENTISRIQKSMYDSWGGSCYGMATTSILDYRNKIAFNENFDRNASTIHDVKSPSASSKILSAINYYHVSQFINFIRYEAHSYSNNKADWNAGLNKLVQTAQKGKPFLFCYVGLGVWNGELYTYGHAIVALDSIQNSDGSFSINAYDNRYPNVDVYIVIEGDKVFLETPEGTEYIIGIEFDDNMSIFDNIDIDGPDNDMKITYGNSLYNNSNAQIEVEAVGNVTITNKAGKTIKITDGQVSGTMDIISQHFIVNDNADGTPAPVTFVFEVADSKTFTVDSTADLINASITTDSMFASASSDNADSIVFGSNEGVYIVGDKMNYKTALSSKNIGYDTVIVEGNSNKDVSLTYSSNGIIAEGVTNADEKITVFTQNADSDSYTVDSGYQNIRISTDKSDNVEIKGSSKNDGNYDVTIGRKESEEPVNPTASAKINVKSSTNVDYRSKVNITATASGVPDGYVLAIYEGNTLKTKGTKDSVSYEYKDGNGKFVELTGDKTFTVKVIDANNTVQKDANGKDLAANVEIKVKQGFFDKLIAFFKGLFGLLPIVEIKP